jgi:hypothetical protein
MRARHMLPAAQINRSLRFRIQANPAFSGKVKVCGFPASPLDGIFLIPEIQSSGLKPRRQILG